MEENQIKVAYLAVDGFRKTRTFKTLAGAQRFAQHYVGATPELGGYYAVSADGVGRVTVDGATLKDLFPKLFPPKPLSVDDAMLAVHEGGKYAIFLDYPRYDNRDAIIGYSRSVHGVYETEAEQLKALEDLEELAEYAITWAPRKSTPVVEMAPDDIPF